MGHQDLKPPGPLEIKLIASPEDFLPTKDNFEVIGAFNPGVTTAKTLGGLETILYVRVAESPIDGDEILLPYFNVKNEEQASYGIGYDRIDPRQLIKSNKKEVTLRDGSVRLRHISLPRLVVLNSKGERVHISQEPIICPSWEFERFGIEDVRITQFDGKYVITYATPHRRSGVQSSILTTKEIKENRSLERVIKMNTPHPEIFGKDVAIFPEKVPSPGETEIIQKGDLVYASFIRPNAFPDISIPGVWISYSPDLVSWGQSHRVILSKNGEVTGTGSPPVKMPYGWLAAYHETTRDENNKTKYVTKLMVLDLENPWKVLYTSPVLLTRENFRDILPEDGFIPNTVFTTGLIVAKDEIRLFHGIDDTWTAETSYRTEDINKFLKQ